MQFVTLEWITPAAELRSRTSTLDEALADLADKLCAQGSGKILAPVGF